LDWNLWPVSIEYTDKILQHSVKGVLVNAQVSSGHHIKISRNFPAHAFFRSQVIDLIEKRQKVGGKLAAKFSKTQSRFRVA
jgi:hypothetical protein